MGRVLSIVTDNFWVLGWTVVVSVSVDRGSWLLSRGSEKSSRGCMRGGQVKGRGVQIV